MKKYNIQVPKEHYYKNYDDLDRFISYFYQIESTIKTEPKNVLEVGVGNKTVSNYLKNVGCDITTFDHDKHLNPDVVGDIRNLLFEDNSFDTVLAFEILEHIPFVDVDKALSELSRISKKNVIVSIPYSCSYIEINFKVSNPIFTKLVHFIVNIPFIHVKINFGATNKEHYWEMGRKNYSKRTVKEKIKKHFIISNEFRPILNPNHYFFVLEKGCDNESIHK